MTKSVTRLIAQFAPEHYKLDLVPDADTMRLRGMVEVTGRKVGRPSHRITFHQNGLKITTARIIRVTPQGDQEIPVTRINHHKSLFEVRLHTTETLYPGNYRVDMTFEAPITTDMNGLYPCFFTKDNVKHTLLMTQFESHYARDAFPCIDEPEAKATFDLSLTTPEGQTVLGNTPVATREVVDDKIHTTFETTPRMSSYLLAFVIGDLHHKTAHTKSGVEVSVWGTIAQPADSFDYALDVAVRSIEFFEDYFGVAYPLKKADHVAVPDFSAGAMENWGLITYREVALLAYPDEASQSSREMIATVIAHETSHQWFGNLVTMRWWNDLWLNESFANLMEYRAVDALFPEWHIWSTFYGQEGLSALRRDAIPGVQAIKTEVHHPDEINTLFDPSIVYAKGGRLLYMLMNYIGEDAFRRGLSAYFATHAYKNTEGADLWQSLSEASGNDIASFMNPWLERSGFPLISVTQKDTTVIVTQEHFSDTPAKADPDRIWPTPLFANNPKVNELLTSSNHTSILDGPEYVIVNEGGHGHYLVRYTEAEHRSALKARIAAHNLGEVDRLMILNTSAMLARAGYVSFTETLDLLDAYHDEASEVVWDIIAVVLGDAKRFVDIDEAVDAALKALTATLIPQQFARLGWDEKANESAADRKLRATIIGLGSYAEVPEILSHGRQLFEAYRHDPAAVATELRSLVFGIAVKTELPGAVDYLLEVHATTTNSELKRDITAALTITRSPAVGERLLSLLKDPELIKPQDADRWLAHLLHNHYMKGLAWDWMVNNWSWIDETYGRDKTFDYFPRYASAICNTPEWQEKYDALFSDKLDNPILRRNILIGQAEIAARVAWLQNDWPAVRHHLGV